MRQKLRIISEEEAEGQATIEMQGEGTVAFVSEDTGYDAVCGSCGALLLMSIKPSRVPSVVIRCARCKHYNDATKLARPFTA